MNYLGIDFGLNKTGVAFASGSLAEPMQVIYEKDVDNLIKRINKIIDEDRVEELVVGVSENEMGEKQKEFAEKLAMDTGLKVNLVDETLSSYDASLMSRDAGINRKKRKKMEDAYAAAIILQGFLDNL